MLDLLNTVNSFTGTGVFALLLIVILFSLSKGKNPLSFLTEITGVSNRLESIEDNHLHEISETLKRIETKLEKINDDIIFIKTKVNGQK